jgi:hypothetical protein
MISPAGRIVAGSIFKPSTKDMKGKVREKPQYFFALAIPKTDPAAQAMLGQFWQLVVENVFNNPRATLILQTAINEWIRPKSGFAWKIDDGDHPKHADKEGYAGHWVVKYTTTIPIKCYDREARQIDPASVKTGYYVDVAMTVQPNGYFDDQAGLYVNPNMVRLLGFGAEIQPGPSASQVFGAAPAPMVGSQTPLAPAPSAPGYGPAPSAPGYGPAPSAPGYGPAPSAPNYGPAPAAPNYGPAPSAPNYGPAPAAPNYGPAPAAPNYGPAPAAPAPSNSPAAPVAPPLAHAPVAANPQSGASAGGVATGVTTAYPSNPPAAPVYAPAPTMPFTPPTLPDVGVQDVQGGATGAPAHTPATVSGASDSAAIASPSEPPLVGFSTGQAQ